jgi:phosphatidylethanolamine-binding protein (PEBP) family uncharacterized protein
MVLYGIPADVKGFDEGELGELSQSSEKFVGGESTMKKATYFGPGTPPNTDWHHYTWTLIATDLDPKAPAAGDDPGRACRSAQGPCEGLGWSGHAFQAPVAACILPPSGRGTFPHSARL